MKMNDLLNKNLIGALIGFLIGWFMIVYGIINTLVVVICTLLGAVLPQYSIKDIKKIIDKMMKGEKEKEL